MPIQTTPVHTRADAETIAFLGEVLAVRLTSEQTNGDVGVLEHLLPAGTATPLHVQPHEGELFYVIDGRITVWLDGELTQAERGDVVWLPRGCAHAFRVDSEQAHVVGLSLPGGHERFFRLAGEPVSVFDLSAAGAAEPDLDRMASAAAQAGVEILGPPPFDENA